MASIEEARAAKVKVGRLLGDHPDLRGVGISRSNGSFGLKVNLADGRDAAVVPCDVDGVPVLVEVVGEVRARPPAEADHGADGEGGVQTPSGHAARDSGEAARDDEDEPAEEDLL